MSEITQCWSDNNEDFSAESLYDLIQSNEELKAGDTVYVGDAVRPEPHHFVTAEDVIDTISNRAYDIGGDYAEGFPDVSLNAEHELDALLAAWINKHCTITFYRVQNVRPYVITDADMAEVLA